MTSPIAEQSGLAKASRRANKNEFTRYAFLNSLKELGARDELRTGWGDIQFGGEQGRGHILYILLQP